MPIYEYRCNDLECQAELEELQKLSDPPLITCPFCKKDTLKRIISSLTVVNKNIPSWEKHSDFVKKLKPKWVKDGRTGERKRLR